MTHVQETFYLGILYKLTNKQTWCFPCAKNVHAWVSFDTGVAGFGPFFDPWTLVEESKRLKKVYFS